MNQNDEVAIIDGLCDQFELGLQQDDAPSVAEMLAQVSRDLRPKLLRELLALEHELLTEEQRLLRIKDYRENLSEYTDIVDEFTATIGTNFGKESDKPKDSLQQIGPYKILQSIGEGGMGSVYMAEQEKPVKRRVALKIIKAGLDSKQVIARFEAERQALAMMDHPSIARILDAGTTDNGQPFFAMELVKGIPLTDYCDQHKLSIADRLELFGQICEGVQHAHQKGIIHRDLKPANILVAEYNGKPVPKIIDFGLAKALEVTNKLTDKTMFTEFGQVLGTLKYMSPEQAGLDSLDIDTRSDIYTLGIILYELLTGSTPLDGNSFKDLAFLKILELVREQDSPRPSSKLTTSKQTISTVTERRQIDPRKLNQILAGDLDWIVMKAIEKDRNRRYESAGAFGEDVQRYLSDEPVEACPPSASYKLRKFVKKNRSLVAAGSIMLLLLVAGIIGTSLGYSSALDSAAKEKTAKEDAQEKQRAAERLAVRNQSIVDVYSQSFLSANPKSGARFDMPARDVLLNAVEQLQTSSLQDDPVGRAKLLQSLGVSLLDLGDYDASRRCLEKVEEMVPKMELDDPVFRISNLSALGVVFRRQSKIGDAIRIYEQAMKLAEQSLPADHDVSLNLLNNLAYARTSNGQYEDARQLLEQRLKLQESLDEDDAEKLMTRHNLARNLVAVRMAAEAETILKDVIARRTRTLGPAHLDTLASIDELAKAYQIMGDSDRALHQFNEAIQRSRKSLGPTHPETLHSVNGYGSALVQYERYDEAIAVLEEVLDEVKDEQGKVPFASQSVLNNLANAYSCVGRLDDAIEAHQSILAQRREVLDASHPNLSSSLFNLGVCYQDAGKLDLARANLEEALELRERHLPDGDFRTNMVRLRLSRVYRDLELSQDAKRLLTDIATSSQPDSTINLAANDGLTVFLLEAKKFKQALATLKELEPKFRKSFAKTNRHMLGVHLLHLGQARFGLGESHYADAASSLLESHQVLTKFGFEGTVAQQQVCAKSLSVLYQEWHSIDPDQGYDQLAEQWAEKVKEE
ncbi:MAG: serine/threonine-protein kinase [Planctomycetota bacterium]